MLGLKLIQISMNYDIATEKQSTARRVSWDIRNVLILIISYLQTDTFNGDDVCLDHSANIVVDFLECGALQGRQLHHSHIWTGPMMVSWYGNVFHIIDTLWGKSIGDWWILLKKGPVMRIFHVYTILVWASCWANSQITADLGPCGAHGMAG